MEEKVIKLRNILVALCCDSKLSSEARGHIWDALFLIPDEVLDVEYKKETE